MTVRNEIRLLTDPLKKYMQLHILVCVLESFLYLRVPEFLSFKESQKTTKIYLLEVNGEKYIKNTNKTICFSFRNTKQMVMSWLIFQIIFYLKDYLHRELLLKKC
jgi:hypothetical protein